MKAVRVAVMTAALLAGAASAWAACDISGDGAKDVSCEPGTIYKTGAGVAIVKLRDGTYTVSMDGPGDLYLFGLQDYATVTAEKNGDGTLVWIPNEEEKRSGGPAVGSGDGKGKIRMGTWSEIVKLRGGN